MLNTLLPFIDERQANILRRRQYRRSQNKIIKIGLCVGILVFGYILINLFVEVIYPPSHITQIASQIKLI